MHPVFKELDAYLSEHEGENISLGSVKVLKATNNSTYTVQTGFAKENATVVSDSNFQVGDIVSFYGIVRNGVLYANKHHTHHTWMYPYDITYYLSFFGLVVFIFLFLRDWEIDLREMKFKRRR